MGGPAVLWGGQVPLCPQQPQLRGEDPPTPPPASTQDALGMPLQSPRPRPRPRPCPRPRPRPEGGLLTTVSSTTSPFIIENINLFLRPVRPPSSAAKLVFADH